MKICFCPLIVVSTTAFSQTAQITSLVSDPTGTAVPKAQVTVTNSETGIRHASSTNAQDYYTVPLLNPGRYELSVQKTGFKAVTRPEIKLDVAQIARVDVGLELGEVKDTVTVVGEAPILSSESAVVGQVIGNRKILDLPLNGRDFTQLATLVPGAMSRGSNSSIEAPAISVNGSRNSKTVFMIDGGSVTSQYFDVSSIVPSVDAIQELSVQSNAFAAENAQGAAVITASLKSGTSQLHGSAFEFLRNQVFDARNFFNTTGVRPPLKQNQFGVTLGGPLTIPHVYSGKDFSELRASILDPLTRTAFPGNLIPAARIAKEPAYFLQFYPLANAPGLFNFAPSRANTTDKFDLRADHRFSQIDALSSSYSFNQGETYNPGQFAANGATTNTVGTALGTQRNPIGERWKNFVRRRAA